MVLKRQTVWLLTMLSLIIVLSIYYISMERMQNHGVLGDVNEENEEETSENSEADNSFEGLESLSEDEDIFVNLEDVTDVFGEYSNISNVSTDQLFENFRLQRMETRSKLNEEYVTAMVSEDATPELQVEALQKFENLQELSQHEEMLESVLRSRGYEDALVIADETEVKIFVKADELTDEETAEIMMLSYDHLGEVSVRVGFQSDKKNEEE